MSLAGEPITGAAARTRAVARAGPGAAIDGRLLAGLWALDAVFIALHVGHRLWWPGHTALSLAEDRGYAELFQVAKTLFVALLLISAGRRRAESLLVLWGALFAYVAIDDAIGLHEAGGHWLAARPDFLPGLGRLASDVGELAVLGTAASLFVAAGVWLWRRGRLRWSERGSMLLVLLVPLVACGVGVDFLHAIVLGQPGWRGLYLLEDGGELLAMSLIAAYAWRLARTPALPLTTRA